MNYLVRLAFTLFDRLVADNESLKGDLIEELENGRSVWWLWRQVIGATVRHPPSVTDVSMFALATTLLMLLSFEAVVVTNLVVRIVFGPPFPDISGYLYLPALDTPAAPIAPVPIVWTLVSVLTMAVSLPTGRVIARLHERASHALPRRFWLQHDAVRDNHDAGRCFHAVRDDGRLRRRAVPRKPRARLEVSCDHGLSRPMSRNAGSARSTISSDAVRLIRK